MRATNGSQRNRPPPDSAHPPRMFAEVKSSPFASVRRQQTPKTGLNFPDAEEVTGGVAENSLPPIMYQNAAATDVRRYLSELRR